MSRKYQKVSKGRGRIRPKLFAPGLDGAELSNLRQLQEVACSTDLVWAWRYCFYVAKKPVVSDHTYDNVKAEEIEFGPGARILQQPASDRVVDYPPHIRELALYLMHKKHWEGKIDYDLRPATGP